MTLSVQIQSLIFSFVYGVFFAVVFNFSYRYFNCNIKYLNFVNVIFFVLFNALLYFLCMRIINDGIIHLYFLLTLLLGFFIENKVDSYFKKKKK
jgi:hypothetical protein